MGSGISCKREIAVTASSPKVKPNERPPAALQPKTENDKSSDAATANTSSNPMKEFGRSGHTSGGPDPGFLQRGESGPGYGRTKSESGRATTDTGGTAAAAGASAAAVAKGDASMSRKAPNVPSNNAIGGAYTFDGAVAEDVAAGPSTSAATLTSTADGGSVASATVASTVTASEISTTRSPLGRLPHIGGLAVSLAFLIDFAERHVAPSQPTWAVVDQLIKPHTLQDTIRYVDLPHVYQHTLPPGRSDYYFVSHAWGRPFWEMVGLCAHYLRGAVAADSYVWCDIFIINQHPGQQQADDLQQLRLAVRDAAAVLVCTDAAGAPFERIWCLFEMWTALTVVATPGGKDGRDNGDGSGGCEEDVVPMAHGPHGGGDGGCGTVRSRSQRLVVLTTGLSAAQRAKLYSQIDAATSKATVLSDKERILADIAASPGGITAFNAAMRCALLLRPLNYEGELATALTEAAPAQRGSIVVTHGSIPAAASKVPPISRTAQQQNWDFASLESWLALPPGHRHHRALALLGPPGTGKSSASAAAMKRLMGPASGARVAVPVVAHFCRARNLQALDPLAAMRTMAYQLSLLFPERLQSYYAFELSPSSKSDRRSGEGGEAGGSSNFALQVIAGMGAAEGAGGGGGSGSGGGHDPVAAAFEALLLRPLELMWRSYEDVVQAASAGGTTADGVGKVVDNMELGGGAEMEVLSARAAAAAATAAAAPPQLVILLDAVDEGDSGAVGGAHENAMLLLLQEHFPRLPSFVRIIVTARPLPQIRALLIHKFDPWMITPDDLRPPPSACAAALAARLARRPRLAAALQQGRPNASASVAASATTAAANDDVIVGGGGGGGSSLKAVAESLWRACKGWMLFLRLAEDILEATATAAAAAAMPTPVRTQAHQLEMSNLPGVLGVVLNEFEVAAAAATAAPLYSLYVKTVVAPAVSAAGCGGGGSKGVGGLPEVSSWGPTAGQLAFLLETLGAAREPLYLSQLQDLGLPAISSRDGIAIAAASSASLGLGCLVTVRGHKLHGLHRSLFEWLSAGGADEMQRLLERSSGGGAAAPGCDSGSGSSGLRRGHVALAAMTLRDVVAARSSQAAAASGSGGARGPRGPDLYSLQHAVAHVLEAAASMTSDGDEEGALNLLRTLFLDFYYWRCVYQEGSAASVVLAALLRHEAIFSRCKPQTMSATSPSVAALSEAAGGSSGSVRFYSGGGGAAAALAADTARWLQSYHVSLLRFPEAILQSALALPSASPIRVAALAALAPPRPFFPPAPSSRPAISLGGESNASQMASVAGVGPASSLAPSPAAAVPAATTAPAVPVPAVVAAQLDGMSWPKAFYLSNSPPEWDACSLTMESRGVTRGLAWVPEPGLIITACDDRKVHLLSPLTGGQESGGEGNSDVSAYVLANAPAQMRVGLMEGHTDRVYCIALRPDTKPKAQPSGRTFPGSQVTLEPRQAATAATAAAAAAATAPDPAGARTALGEAVVVVASGSLDGRVTLWDGSTRMQLQLLEPGEETPSDSAAEGNEAEGRPAVTSFGFSVAEDRPAGPSAKGSVDCLVFSPDGTWLAAGTSDGSVTVWRILDGDDALCGDGFAVAASSGGRGSGGSAAASTAVAAVPVRAIKAWVSPQAHKAAVAGLTFMELSQLRRYETGTRLRGREGTGAGDLPALVLASCSEDGCIHIWDPRVADSAGAVRAVSEPLRTFRSDSEAQVQYAVTGEQPVTTPADPWFIGDVLSTPVNSSNIDSSSSRNGGDDDCRTAATPGLADAPRQLLAGVAEDVDVRQSHASYRSPEHHCLATGPGLPAGCLLVGSGSGPVAVWDVGSGLLQERLRGHVDAVHCLVLEDGGPNFASGSGDCTVRLWRHLPTADPHGWRAALQAALQQAREDAAATAATAAAELLRGGLEAGPETPTRKQEQEPQDDSNPPVPRRCRRPCQWQCVAVLRGHTRLVTSLAFLTTTVAQRTNPQRKAGPRPGSSGLKYAAKRSGSGSESRSDYGHIVPSSASRLASASVDFTVRIWLVDSTSAPDNGGGYNGAGRPMGHEGFSVNTVAVSPDGRLVATGADDFQVCVWDSVRGAHRRTLRCFYGRVRAVAFSRDSQRMATAAEDGGVLIFDITNGDEFSNIGWCRGHTKAATGVAFSPDGFSVASSSEDGTARVWAIRGFQTALLEGHPSGATAIAWAEEGSLVATGAARGDPGVQLWDARMGMRLNTFRYHVADVAVLAFGSCTEAVPPSCAHSRPTSPSTSNQAQQKPTEPRCHVLLMSVDVRGLACVWDVWGGGLLHCINHVQGADLTGSKLLWLQARAIQYADMQELLQSSSLGQQDEADNDGVVGQQRRQRVTTALAALYPSGEAVDVMAAGKGLSCVAVVTDKQRLYIFRPMD